MRFSCSRKFDLVPGKPCKHIKWNLDRHRKLHVPESTFAHVARVLTFSQELNRKRITSMVMAILHHPHEMNHESLQNHESDKGNYTINHLYKIIPENI